MNNKKNLDEYNFNAKNYYLFSKFFYNICLFDNFKMKDFNS